MCQFGEDYRLADYYYIKSFCFGTMEDWDISEARGFNITKPDLLV